MGPFKGLKEGQSSLRLLLRAIGVCFMTSKMAISTAMLLLKYDLASMTWLCWI
jgi:hypothetical protein